MTPRREVAIAAGRRVQIVSTRAADGDFRIVDPVPDPLERRRRAIIDAPWTWLRQVHGAKVESVDHPGDRSGEEADGVLTSVLNAPIAVTTADCAPVVLIGSTSVAVVHAGWRGAVEGIIEVAGDMLRDQGAAPVASFVGPCIHPTDYAFGLDDLAPIVARYDDSIAGVTTDGQPALDLPALVAAAVVAAGWPAPDRPANTADPAFFSHRTRGDTARQTTVAWIEAS